MQANRVLDTMLEALTHERSLRRFFELCWRYGRSTGETERPLRRSYWRSFLGFAALLSGLDLGLYLAYAADHPALVTATLSLGAFWFVLVALLTYFMLGLFRREDGRFLVRLGLPNTLTIGRLLLVPFFFNLIAFFDEVPEVHMALLILFGVVALSDIADGFIARKLGAATVFGRVIDPVCDMVFNAMIALALTLAGALPWAFLLLVWVRYFTPLFGGYFLFLYKRPFHIYATLIGKLSGFTLGFVLGGALWNLLFPGTLPPWLFQGVVALAVFLLSSNIAWVIYRGVTAFRGPPTSS